MNNNEVLTQFKSKTLIFCKTVLYPISICYAYFVVVGILALSQEDFSSLISLMYFLVFHILLMYTVVFYIRIFPTEGVTTKDFFYPEAEENIGTDYLNMFVAEKIKNSVISRKSTCSKCGVYKPPRSHHCKACDRCYLKMDHHCMILNECIGWHNYKFFVLFLFFNSIFSLYIVFTLLIKLLVSSLEVLPIVHYIICTVIFAIELVVSVVMLCYHIYLIWHNETTIENNAINSILNGDVSMANLKIFQEGVLAENAERLDSGVQNMDRRALNPYNIEPFINFKEVFGDYAKGWFLPTFTSNGNGVQFLKNIKDEAEELTFN